MLELPPVKVKGLIKGLRYISQIFDGEKEKEKEMVIGIPTDVKHVAHIGHDGHAPANPSWMNDFHSAPLSSSSGLHGKELGSPRSASQEILQGGGEMASPKPRRNISTEPPTQSRSSRRSRHSSKNKASGSEASSRDGSEPRRSRRNRQKAAGTTAATQLESESSVSDLPNIPKQSRRKERKSRLSDGVSSSSGSNNPPLTALVPA